ncbi:MAG: ABC transporter permease [Deferribacteraceae bacterium]|jgi:putative ABC transport system permease protein|nr:ABC transporter permease [Deferribacteraceae bacterium]
MFIQMIKGAFKRQTGKFIMIALTAALGISVATAMLNTMLGVGDKVNQELKAYGANITVRPKFSSILSDVYDEESSDKDFINEKDVLKLKTIFWAHNIVDFAPFLTMQTTIDGGDYRLVGTWYNKELDLPTGEVVVTGIIGLKSWWQLNGEWIADNAVGEVMLGSEAAKRLNLSVGDKFYIEGRGYTVRSIFSAGGDEDEDIYMPLSTVQEISGSYGKAAYIDLSALTTPENELARKAGQDPRSLTTDEYETWYCTAYISSITYQIEEAIPNVRAKAVLQISQSEGAILNKIQLLMLLLTVLTLLCTALGISNLVTAYVMEKSVEIGLLKAIGAIDIQIILTVLAQVMIAALIGAMAGYFCGLKLASIIGRTVFNSVIEPSILTIPIVSLLLVLTVVLGSLPAMKMLLLTRPAVVLHG